MFHYPEKRDLRKGGGLILGGDIKKICLNIQFIHYILKKPVALYFEIDTTLWTEEKADHPKKLPSYSEFREM